MPVGAASFSEALRWGAETYHALKKLLPRPGPVHRGRRRGRLRPEPGRPTRRPCSCWSRPSRRPASRPGDDIAIALDPATTEFFNDGAYVLAGEGRTPRRRRDGRLLGRPVRPRTRSCRSRTAWPRRTGTAGPPLTDARRRPGAARRRRPVRHQRRAPRAGHRAPAWPTRSSSRSTRSARSPRRSTTVGLATRTGYTRGDVAPLGRDRGRHHRRPRRGHQLRPDQDRRPGPLRPRGQVQPAAAHRGAPRRGRRLPRPRRALAGGEALPSRRGHRGRSSPSVAARSACSSPACSRRGTYLAPARGDLAAPRRSWRCSAQQNARARGSGLEELQHRRRDRAARPRAVQPGEAGRGGLRHPAAAGPPDGRAAAAAGGTSDDGDRNIVERAWDAVTGLLRPRCGVLAGRAASLPLNSEGGGGVDMSILGNRVLRTEDPKFLTVGGTYVDDLRDPLLDGAAHVTFVRSTVAHAAHHAIDTSRGGRRRPAWSACSPPPTSASPPRRRRCRCSTPADDRGRGWPTASVRFVGEPVAVVVTEERYQGADAAELVVVDYEPLAASSTSRTRGRRTRSCCSPSAGTNVVHRASPTPAAPTTFFDGCEVVVAAAHRQPAGRRRPARGARLRGRAWDGDGRLTCGARRRRPHGVRDALAERLGLEPGTGAGDRARRRRRLRRQDRRPRRGAPRSPWLARHARPAGALDRDPHREHAGHGPRPGPGAARSPSAAAATARSQAYRLDVLAGRRRLPLDRAPSSRSSPG